MDPYLWATYPATHVCACAWQVFVDLRPDEELAADWVPVRTVTEGVQAAPRVVGHEARCSICQCVL